jgi:hypothetical protein
VAALISAEKRIRDELELRAREELYQILISPPGLLVTKFDSANDHAEARLMWVNKDSQQLCYRKLDNNSLTCVPLTDIHLDMSKRPDPRHPSQDSSVLLQMRAGAKSGRSDLHLKFDSHSTADRFLVALRRLMPRD